jgi:hypothetical protein
VHVERHSTFNSFRGVVATNYLQVKVKVTLRLTVSQSVSLGVEPHLGLMTRYLLLFDRYGLVFLWGALSDKRTGLFFVYAAGFARAVFLGSESLGTRDHILLSQTWDFPFRRLLRLAGSRWRYSTPPPHGLKWQYITTLMARETRKSATCLRTQRHTD